MEIKGAVIGPYDLLDEVLRMAATFPALNQPTRRWSPRFIGPPYIYFQFLEKRERDNRFC